MPIFKLALLSPNSISCKIPQRFGELPQGEKIRRPQQIVFLSYCLQETYIFLGDIHFLIGDKDFSNWKHTFFLLETYIFLPCLYPEAIRNNQLGFLLRPILILAFTRKRFPNWHLLLLHFVIWQNL